MWVASMMEDREYILAFIFVMHVSAHPIFPVYAHWFIHIAFARRVLTARKRSIKDKCMKVKNHIGMKAVSSK